MTAEATIAERTYTIGELAAISGLSVHALRWYEAQGLFPRDIPRTPGGQRIFGDEAVRWLALLNRLRDSAMPVADMARYSQLVRAGEGNEADRIALMESHARYLDAQIEELIASREVIRDKIIFYRRAVASRT
ncbi:MerR family transcriptional regulator [Cryobacterium algoricola]|uniref:MerR family transcriptional regulator n=1 Tax=Cryobacterium algoricola TaxID=1259183 RepID=A0ABY2IA55_9MICO|nr:MerR family transcriptional regulator [Cryobacterium algoricola]TFB85569.1 MerR family transcriptional regulator [Cryobacterium algoricola]